MSEASGHTEEAMRRVHDETQADEAVAAQQAAQTVVEETQQPDPNATAPGDGEGETSVEERLARVEQAAVAMGTLASKLEAMVVPDARGRGGRTRPGAQDPRNGNGNGNGQRNGRGRQSEKVGPDYPDYPRRIPHEAGRLIDFGLTTRSLRALQGWDGQDQGFDAMVKQLKRGDKEAKGAAVQLEARRRDITRLSEKDKAINNIPGAARTALRVHAESAMGAEADKLLSTESRKKSPRFNDTALDALTHWDGTGEQLGETIRLLSVGNPAERAAAAQLHGNQKLLEGLGDNKEFGGMMAEQAERAVRNERAKIAGKTGKQLLETVDLELVNIPSFPAYMAHVARNERIRRLSGAERVQAGAERATAQRAILASMVSELEADTRARREALSRIHDEDLIGVDAGAQRDIDRLENETAGADARDEFNRLENEITQMENTRLMWLNKEIPEAEPVEGIKLEEIQIEEEAKATPTEDQAAETQTVSAENSPRIIQEIERDGFTFTVGQDIKVPRTAGGVSDGKIDFFRYSQSRGEMVARVSYSDNEGLYYKDVPLSELAQANKPAETTPELASPKTAAPEKPDAMDVANLGALLDEAADEDTPSTGQQAVPLVSENTDDVVVDAEVVDDAAGGATRMKPVGPTEPSDRWGYYRSPEEKAADIVDAEIVEDDKTPAVPGTDLELHPSPDITLPRGAARLATVDRELAAKRQELSETTVDDNDRASMDRFAQLENEINSLSTEHDELQARQEQP